MMRRLVLVLLLLLVVLAALPSGGGQLDVSALVDGPDAVAPSSKVSYNVTIFPAPEGDQEGMYTASYYLVGDNLEGASPKETTPLIATGRRNVLQVNVTAPSAEGRVQLVVRASATLANASGNTTVVYPIVVVTPVTLTATFRNAGSATAVNVTVRFFVDGEAVGETIVPRIDPGGTATATFRWMPVGLQPGQHVVRAEADLNGDGRVDPALGEVVVSDLFLRKGEETNLLPFVLIAVVLGIVVLVGLAVAARRRGES